MHPTKRAVQKFWDSEACGERYGSEQDATRYILEPEILDFADFESSANHDVLEVGVGMGADFVRWSRAGARPTGVDLTQRSATLTQQRLITEGLEGVVLVGDAERLPFSDQSFDLVYSWGVLHHTPDTQTAVQEAIRVLRPGGELKLMLYHRQSWLAGAAWVRFGLLRGTPFISLKQAIGHIESPGTQAFTREETQTMLQGLERVTVSPSLTHWDRRWAGWLTKVVGDRFGWFLLIRGRKPQV